MVPTFVCALMFFKQKPSLQITATSNSKMLKAISALGKSNDEILQNL
jgi:hypothetical protein